MVAELRAAKCTTCMAAAVEDMNERLRELGAKHSHSVAMN
jgi:hypothetical protein